MANRSTPASVLPADTHIGSLMNRIQLYIVSFKTRLASGDRAVSLCVTGWLSTVGICYFGFAYWPHIMLVTCIYNLRGGGGYSLGHCMPSNEILFNRLYSSDEI